MSVIDLVSSVKELADRYGLDAVRNTVDYIGAVDNFVRVGDFGTNVYFTISKDQYRSIGNEYRAGNKITAIKMLRDIVHCGLKEAKDVVENTKW